MKKPSKSHLSKDAKDFKRISKDAKDIKKEVKKLVSRDKGK